MDRTFKNVADFPVIRRSTIVEKVVAAIVEYIKADGLRERDKLPTETEFAKMFGVSRLAVREALIRLRSLGVIDSRQGAGWFVKKFEPADTFRQLSPILKNFTSADLNQIMTVRMILEPAISQLAARNISEKGLRKLQDLLECMKENTDDKEAFIECDMEFHWTLAHESGNKILIVLSAILTDLSRTAQQAYRNTVEDRQRSIEFHKSIYEAVRARDEDWAEEAMSEHINDVWARVE